jgi:Restriction endonuclease BglII
VSRLRWNGTIKIHFFDRDLNNFRLLFELRAIQVGVIITRSWELQEIFKQLGRGASYGKATTHHEKLWPKIEGGGGGGCPVLTFAIRPVNFVDDGLDALEALRVRIEAEKAARKTARRRGLPVPDDEDDES